MTAKLYDKLKHYAKNGRYPFCMPGHKMGRGIQEKDVFSLDITEIEGFDNIHNPKGIIKEAQNDCASIFGAKKTFFALNGSTGALQAAVMAVCAPNDKIIMARNCHRSVYGAVILTGAIPCYVMPEIIDGTDIIGGVTPKNIENSIKNNKTAKAVVITSPTAEGIVSDIASIADIAHKNNMVLIVDEAHGAHFNFSNSFPDSALSMGADIVVQSAHKTLPSPTQTAMLHIGSNIVDAERIREVLSVIETSSPSYIFMAMLDKCRDYIYKNGNTVYKNFTDIIKKERERILGLNNISIIDESFIGKYGIKNIDISKITVVSKNINCMDVTSILRNKYNMEMEMSSMGHMVAITTISDDISAIKLLFDALVDIDKNIETNNKCLILPKYIYPKTAINIREAFFMPPNEENYWNCNNKISAEFIIPYPPGIPIICPGEVITSDMLKYIRFLYDNGIEITGVKYQNLEKLRVLS